MQTLDIVARLDAIEAASDDAKKAHALELELFEDFIEHVAKLDDENPELAERARIVLESREIDFER